MQYVPLPINGCWPEHGQLPWSAMGDMSQWRLQWRQRRAFEGSVLWVSRKSAGDAVFETAVRLFLSWKRVVVEGEGAWLVPRSQGGVLKALDDFMALKKTHRRMTKQNERAYELYWPEKFCNSDSDRVWKRVDVGALRTETETFLHGHYTPSWNKKRRCDAVAADDPCANKRRSRIVRGLLSHPDIVSRVMSVLHTDTWQACVQVAQCVHLSCSQLRYCAWPMVCKTVRMCGDAVLATAKACCAMRVTCGGRASGL